MCTEVHKKILRTAFFPSFVFFLNAKMSPSHAKINNSKKNFGVEASFVPALRGTPELLKFPCANIFCVLLFAKGD